MEFYKTVYSRKSIRKYKPDLVPEDTVIKILDAARVAPSWANMQGVRYVVVRDPNKVKALIDAIGQKWTRDAPMFIVACIQERGSGKNKNGLKYFMLDVGIAFEHLILAATAEGLGTCWIGYFDEDGVKKALNIPKKFRVVAITPLGYPDGPPKDIDRLALEKISLESRLKVERQGFPDVSLDIMSPVMLLEEIIPLGGFSTKCSRMIHELATGIIHGHFVHFIAFFRFVARDVFHLIRVGL